MRQALRRAVSVAEAAALSLGTVIAIGTGSANAATNIGDGALDPV